MNADHSTSLSHYLQHYASLPRSAAYQSPQIVEFGTPRMVVEYGPAGGRKRWEYGFEPPMRAGEGRGRLVGMHKEAREALGISDVTLNHFCASPVSLLSTLLLTLFELWLFLLPASRAGSLFWWHAPVFNPLLSLLGQAQTTKNLGAAVKCWWLGFIFVTHAWEIPTALETTLRRYNVTSKRLRVIYSILTFFGGFPVWSSVRQVGRAEEQKLADKKH
ncbi:hypothetical protein JCM6882_008915 [Rhodosporidiobolus microsporus]